LKFTLDEPAPGLVLAQPVRGFRYGAEAFWLAGWILEDLAEGASVLDLGTGSGIITGLLARAGARAIGIDVRPEWREAWEFSADRRSIELDLRICDVRALHLGEGFTRVVSNPPFFALRDGPTPEDAWKAAARAETHGTLSDFVGAARRHLDPGGRLVMVVPVPRADELVELARSFGLHPVRSIQVGARRWMAEFGAHPSAGAHHEYLEEQDPRAQSWYRRCGARFNPTG